MSIGANVTEAEKGQDKDAKDMICILVSIRETQIIPNYTKYNFAFCILHYFSEKNHGLV